jgi:hypothetical protein
MGISLLMFGSLLNHYNKTVFLPIPHNYVEGVSCWMAREISEGKHPYGNIEEIPSRYSAYGPLFASAVAALSYITPNKSSIPITIDTNTSIKTQEDLKILTDLDNRFIIIGRILNGVLWVLTGFMLGLLTGRWKTALLLTPIPAIALSSFTMVWAWRIDSLVIFLHSVILLILTRQKKKELLYLLPLATACLGLTKPTSIMELAPVLILAYGLTNTKIREFISNTALPIITSLIVAGTAVMIINLLTSGWMLNNIITIQSQSGYAEDNSIVSKFFAFFSKPSVLLISAWTLLTPAIIKHRKAAILYLAVSLSLLLCGLATLKWGGDTNYYMPLLVIGLGVCTISLKNPIAVLIFLLAVALTSLPIKPKYNAPEHGEWKLTASETSNLAELLKSHQGDQVLTEDAFFSVLAKGQPLVSDIFQYATITEAKNKNGEDNTNINKLSSLTETIWSDWRVSYVLKINVRKLKKLKDTPQKSHKEIIIRDQAGHLVKGANMLNLSPATKEMNNKNIGIKSAIYYFAIPSLLIFLLGIISQCLINDLKDRKKQ